MINNEFQKTLAIPLKDCTEQVHTCIEQIQAYEANENIINGEASDFIIRNIESMDHNVLQSLFGMCKNSANIIREV